MIEETRIDKDYLEAFNLGYELARELSLKSPMFQDIDSNNTRLQAMQAGMEEYKNEITQAKTKTRD